MRTMNPNQSSRVLHTLQDHLPESDEQQLTRFMAELIELLETPMAEIARGLQEQSHTGTPDLILAFQATPTRNGARHIVQAGGKRLRPLVTLLGCMTAGAQPDHTTSSYAVAAELVHNATLLHDDILDEAVLRRGNHTVNTLHGNSVAVLAGDHLLVEALRHIQAQGRPDVLSRMIETLSSMVMAEALQLEQKGRFVVDTATYDRIAHGKTAALFGWCLYAGALSAGIKEKPARDMQKAGQLFGYAFQLVDDCIDLQGSASVTGKRALADLREGKLTYPLMLACQVDQSLRDELISLAGDNPTDNMVATTLARIKATHALETTRMLAHDKLADCQQLLQQFPNNPGRQYLCRMATLLSQRIH